jgi:hypothetical protein
MKPFTRILAMFVALWGALPPDVAAAEPVYGAGTSIESLTVGSTTYHDVRIRSLNARTVMFTHAGGMASIHLKELPQEWQERFHYDAAADAEAEAALRNVPAPPVATVAPRKIVAKAKAATKFDELLQNFGQPATVQAEVDLRPTFFKLELGVKNQGLRPSCAVFAIVSALEFQNAELTGKVEKYSEEYLLWAVRKSLRRPHPSQSLVPTDPTGQTITDEGFTLSEVVAALRAYGIPLQSSMPNTFGSGIEDIGDPAPEVVREARVHQRVFVEPVPGRDSPTLLNNVIQVLNAGLPVAVGMNWPSAPVIKGYLSTQTPPPDRGHAVTLVGYKVPNGRLDQAYFIFKNSWGPKWGQGGYGTVTYDYLSKYLTDAVLLEIQVDKKA